MRYRDNIQHQLDKVEGKLKSLEFFVKRKEPVSNFIKTLEEAKECLNEAKSYIDREPASQEERSGLM